MSAATAHAAPRPRRAGRDLLGEADWVNAAVRQMLRGSVADVKVERLARELKVTRGSFYWHFRNRAALLAAVLAHWEQMTVSYNAVLARHDPDPHQRLLRLLLLPEDAESRIPPGEFESAIRAWARRSPQVRQVTARVDALRLQTITQIMCDLGASAQRAPALALITSANTGMLWQRYQLSPTDRHDLITEFYPMLLAAISPNRQRQD
jgi:AcrR family transcriptional regulator